MRLALVVSLALAGCSKGDRPPPPKLVLGELQPAFGDPSGQKVVQISGSGFDTHSTVEVKFGDKVARAIVVAPDRIQLESPPGTNGEEAAVTVRFPDGRGGTLAQKYRWITADADSK